MIEGTHCGWCRKEVAFGEDVAICNACETVHHAACWDRRQGCSEAQCENAPLEELEPPAPKKEVPLGRMLCPHCGRQIKTRSKFCRFCKKATTPDGIYRGPKTKAPGAVASLVYGILAFFICGIIFGIVAISKANQAQKATASNPTLSGAGLATAGKVLGIITLVLWSVGLILRFAGR
ncbi:MAG: DUF4190 domain-containing protein [Planctomycetota bacterium]